MRTASGCSSTARGSPRPGRRASGWRTTRSCCSSTARATTARSTCRAAASGASGRSCSTPPTRRRRRARDVRVGRGAGPDRALAPAAAADRLTWPGSARPTGCSSGADLGFRDAAALVPYLRDLGVSHLYLSPSFAAREGSTHGYDVVDPRQISEALGGEEGFRVLAGSARSAGLGLAARHRPEPHGDGRGQPVLDRPEAAREVLRPGPGDRSPPAFLRHRPPRRGAAGGPRGVRGDPRAGAAAGGGGPGRRPADRPSRRPRRPGSVPGAAARRRRRARLGREDPRSRRAPARLAGRGDGRLRVPQRRRGAVRRPGGRGGADDAVDGAGGRRAALRRMGGGGEGRAGRDDVRARPRLAAAAVAGGRGAGGGGLRAARLPHLHPRTARARGPVGAARGGAGRVARLGAARLRHPLPADDAADHGQGRRGHRLLPLPAAARAQRRRRRPEPLRDLRRDVPRRQRRARGALPAQPALQPDARHEAVGRRPRAARRAGRAGGRVGRAVRAWRELCAPLREDGVPDAVEET